MSCFWDGGLDKINVLLRFFCLFVTMNELQAIREIKGKRFLFRAETSSNSEDYKKFEELRYSIWGEPNDNLAGTRNMICENYFHDGNCLFIGCYAEDDHGRFLEGSSSFVGFSYGFVGVLDKAVGFRRLDNIVFYSQYTAVKTEHQNYGLGILIKEFQKDILTGIFGIYTVTCTYDPLISVNAYRNIHHFGMDILEYKPVCYEEFTGNLNRADVPCDRFYLRWDLKRKILKPAYDLEALLDAGQVVIQSDLADVKVKDRILELEIVAEVNLELDHEFLLLEIPFNFYRMLQETDVKDSRVRQIPIEWRMKTRAAFQELFRRGYKVIDFGKITKHRRNRDFYVLKR